MVSFGKLFVITFALSASDFALCARVKHTAKALTSQVDSAESEWFVHMHEAKYKPRAPRPTPVTDEEKAQVLIEEYNDKDMGIAWSMLDNEGWKKKNWGILGEPSNYTWWAQSYVSISTFEKDMSVYRRRGYGLALHISPEYDFWKYFQVIKSGKHKGNIVGGPGDGGSHTAPHSRVPSHKQGKDYDWFYGQKKKILDKYNTVYKQRDYNEFITNGLSKTAVAGIFHSKLRGQSDESNPSDDEMCQFLSYRFQYPQEGKKKWPIYSYSRSDKRKKGHLEIERYLECDCCTSD